MSRERLFEACLQIYGDTIAVRLPMNVEIPGGSTAVPWTGKKQVTGKTGEV